VTGERFLDLHRSGFIFGRSHHGGGHTSAHFFGVGRASDNAHRIVGIFRLNDLAHGEKRLFLQSLAGVDQNDIFVKIGLHTLCHGTDIQGRHHKNHHVAVFHTDRVCGESDAFRDLYPRKLGLVLSVPQNCIYDLLGNIPDRNGMPVLKCCNGKADTEAACTKNRDFCHMNLLYNFGFLGVCWIFS